MAETLQELTDRLTKLNQATGRLRARETNYKNRHGNRDMGEMLVVLEGTSSQYQSKIDEIRVKIAKFQAVIDQNQGEGEEEIKEAAEVARQKAQTDLEALTKEKDKIDKDLSELRTQSSEIETESAKLAAERDDIMAQFMVHPDINTFLQREIEDKYNRDIQAEKKERDEAVSRYTNVEEALTQDSEVKEIVVRLKSAYKTYLDATDDFEDDIMNVELLNSVNEARLGYDAIVNELSDKLCSLGLVDAVVDNVASRGGKFVITKSDIENIAATDGEDYNGCIQGKQYIQDYFDKTKIPNLERQKQIKLKKLRDFTYKQDPTKANTRISEIDSELQEIDKFLVGENGNPGEYETQKNALEQAYNDAEDRLNGTNGKKKIDEEIAELDAQIQEGGNSQKIPNPDKEVKKQELADAKKPIEEFDKVKDELKSLEDKKIGRDKMVEAEDAFREAITNSKVTPGCISRLLNTDENLREAFEAYKAANIQFRKFMLDNLETPNTNEHEIKRVIMNYQRRVLPLINKTGISAHDWNNYFLFDAIQNNQVSELDDIYFDNSAQIKNKYAQEKAELSEKERRSIDNSIDKLVDLQNRVLNGRKFDLTTENQIFESYERDVNNFSNNMKKQRFLSSMGTKIKDMVGKFGKLFNKDKVEERSFGEDFYDWRDDREIYFYSKLDDERVIDAYKSYLSAKETVEHNKIFGVDNLEGEDRARYEELLELKSKAEAVNFEDIEQLQAEIDEMPDTIETKGDTTALEAQRDKLIKEGEHYSKVVSDYPSQQQALEGKNVNYKKKRDSLSQEKARLEEHVNSLHTEKDTPDGKYIGQTQYQKIAKKISKEVDDYLDGPSL